MSTIVQLGTQEGEVLRQKARELSKEEILLKGSKHLSKK